jgi:hypothetical protein
MKQMLAQRKSKTHEIAEEAAQERSKSQVMIHDRLASCIV